MTSLIHPDSDLSPIQTGDRIISLDIIRALALFGVLLMNLPEFSGATALATMGKPVATGTLDAWIAGISKVLVNGKAMSCFAMLFGIGLFIQFERAHAKGLSQTRFALRRLGGLFLIGMVHWVLIWDGDILTVYALVGFTLLPLLRSRPRAFLFVAFAAFLVSDALFLLLRLLHAPIGFNTFAWAEANSRAADMVCGHGSWLSAMTWRLSRWANLSTPAYFLACVPYVMPMFMTGALLWRLGIPRGTQDQTRKLSALFHGTFWIGLALSLIGTDPFKLVPEAWKKYMEGTPWLYVGDAGMYLLAVGYFTALLRLLARPKWTKRLSILAPMGRMALTNYLSQSLVFTWVFYRQGFGFWGRTSPKSILVCALMFYVMQVAWSRWWLARFKFGPCEWLWRSMTYGKWQPFLIPGASGDGIPSVTPEVS